MQIKIITSSECSNKHLLRKDVVLQEIETFRNILLASLAKSALASNEKAIEKIIENFIEDIGYKNKFYINTSVESNSDIVIYQGSSAATGVGVLIEVKHNQNTAEMFSPNHINSKSLHELILYYLNERSKGTIGITHLIITNFREWYIIDSQIFEKIFYTTEMKNSHKKWREKGTTSSKTEQFYTEIAKPYIAASDATLPVLHISLQEAATYSDIELLRIVQLFSPEYLLKIAIEQDSNTLNQPFYEELLHIMGLEEAWENNILKIKRKSIDRRNEASLLENAIVQVAKNINKNENTDKNNADNEAVLFEAGLSLIILWINRILFLKLLEAQIIQYHTSEEADIQARREIKRRYGFLNASKIRDFDELEELFFEVLAVPIAQRKPSVQEKYGDIPYLNSSLFEVSDIEQELLRLCCLKDRLMLPYWAHTILVSEQDKMRNGSALTLHYLFDFLDAYDFGAESSLHIQDAHRPLINAAVLGLVFEQLNGYAEGAYFTPGYITMYMCRDVIRKAIVDKFSESEKIEFTTFDDLCNYTNNKYHNIDILRLNTVFNRFRLCDPAVGSGHFLVSALNELLVCKSEMGLLADAQGGRLRGVSLRLAVEADELTIYYNENRYRYRGYAPKGDNQAAQMLIFREKQTLMEQCLFGVDINPNSVAICCLRLWIELLKNAYYTEESGYKDLQTLPNIDLNIKTGNSLVQRFEVAGAWNILPKDKQHIRKLVKTYKEQSQLYKLTNVKYIKRQAEKTLLAVREDIAKMTLPNDKDFQALKKLKENLENPQLTLDVTSVSEWHTQFLALQKKVKELEDICQQKLQRQYKNAIEWRFIFPEILSEEDARFEGFDVVIANPPYIKEYDNRKAFQWVYANPLYQGKMDLWYLFGGLGISLLKPNGYMAFIAPNNWVSNSGASKFRQHLIEHTKIVSLTDFGSFMVFAKAAIQTMVMVFQKQQMHAPYTIEIHRLTAQKPRLQDTMALLQKEAGEGREFFTQAFRREDWEGKFLTFAAAEILAGIKFIESKANFILDKYEIAQGIVAPQDFVNKASRDILEKKFHINDGVFNLSSEEVASMTLLPWETMLLRPRFTSKELKKYGTIAANRYWIIYTRSHFKNGTCMEHYPTLKRHLDQFSAVITSSNAPYGLHRAREESFFQGEKIMSLRKCKEPTFTFTDTPCYVQAEYFIIKTNRIDLRYLTGLLNSRLLQFWFRYAGKMQGSIYQIDKEPLLHAPIFCPTPEQQAEVADLVAEIIRQQQADAAADVSIISQEIDEIIYTLYDISTELRLEIETLLAAP